MKRVRVKNAFGCLNDSFGNSSCQVIGELVLVPARTNGTVEIKDFGMYLPYIISKEEPILKADAVLIKSGVVWAGKDLEIIDDSVNFRYKILAMPEDFSEDQLKHISQKGFDISSKVVVDCKPLIKYPSIKGVSLLSPRLIGYHIKSPLSFKTTTESETHFGVNIHRVRSKILDPVYFEYLGKMKRHAWVPVENQDWYNTRKWSEMISGIANHAGEQIKDIEEKKFYDEMIESIKLGYVRTFDLPYALIDAMWKDPSKKVPVEEFKEQMLKDYFLKSEEKTFLGLPESLFATIEHVFSENYAKPSHIIKEEAYSAMKQELMRLIGDDQTVPLEFISQFNELLIENKKGE